MATAWPTGVPAPLVDDAKMESGTTVHRRVCQSGRVEQRRFGSGAPDKWEMSWLLDPTDHDALRTFWETDLALGTGEFSADWILNLGYSAGYVGRFLGFPKETSHRSDNGDFGYAKFSAVVLISEE